MYKLLSSAWQIRTLTSWPPAINLIFFPTLQTTCTQHMPKLQHSVHQSPTSSCPLLTLPLHILLLCLKYLSSFSARKISIHSLRSSLVPMQPFLLELDISFKSLQQSLHTSLKGHTRLESATSLCFLREHKNSLRSDTTPYSSCYQCQAECLD